MHVYYANAISWSIMGIMKERLYIMLMLLMRDL